ncbi:MAG: hypothetical protein OXE84_12245 [Rhodobacteraceae bacterium]|nr:hypothetical protein [Paracoccaceae bacterium]MCY4198028.1 hypothetical protein [Paracoccaceae bacterium]MCY4328092.1 hypothetical protein [Paracoccaceae bacterium]
MTFNPGWITLARIATIIAFLWSLHRDMRSISDRVSRLEGTVDTLVKVLVNRKMRATQRS